MNLEVRIRVTIIKEIENTIFRNLINNLIQALKERWKIKVNFVEFTQPESQERLGPE